MNAPITRKWRPVICEEEFTDLAWQVDCEGCGRCLPHCLCHEQQEDEDR